MENMGLNNGFEKLKDDAKKVVAGAAVLVSMGSPAFAQNTTVENGEHANTIETKAYAQESDSILLKQITNIEKHWEGLSDGRRGIDNPKSFTIISRSEIEKTISPFSSPLNDRYVAQDVITDLSEHYQITSRQAAVQHAFDSEHLLATEGFSKDSHFEYTKPAYYFVIEEQANTDGGVEFVAKMISLDNKTAETIGSVKTDSTIDTVEKENFFDDTIIPTLRASIEEKIKELGLASQKH